MTVSAPEAIAFATSPDEVMPPSAITGTPWRIATSATSKTAVTCGTPTPATTRVVQIEPGPTPALRQSAPASISASAASPGGDVAGDQLDVELRLDPPHHLDDGARVAVRGVDDEHVDLGGDERRGALERVGADADGGADAQPPALVLRRERVALALLDVLDGDQALEPSGAVDDRQLLDLVAAEQQLGLGERRADRRGDEVLARHQLAAWAAPAARRSGGRGS